MKNRFSPDFAVGVSALLGLLIMVYISLEVNDTGSFGKTVSYYAKFDTASGVVKRSPLEIAGIMVGYVENIVLDGDRARLIFRVRRDTAIYEDGLVQIKDRGVLGDKYIQLHPGTATKARILPDGEIPSRGAGGGLEEVTSAVSEITATLKALLSSDNPQGALGQSIVNIRDMTADFKEVMEANQARINKILANVEDFTGDMSEISRENKNQIKQVLASLGEVAESLKTSLGKDGNVTQATEKLNHTMASIQGMVDKIDRGEGTIGKLINDERTINNVNETIEGVNETLGLFRRIQLGIRYRGEFLSDAKELQSLIGFTIAPTPDKYILFELVSAPVGQTTVTNTTVNAAGNPVSNTETVQTDDKVTLTLLFGKRFLDTTFRFGMIRGEGGAGMDFHLFRDKLTLSVEGFDFNRFENRAHLRAYATLTLYKHLLLTGGVDDAIERSGRRNAFFGAGLQFFENDLKALLPAVGTGLN